MARPPLLPFALVGCTFVGFGVIADRVLEREARRSRDTAQAAAAETARLTAESLRATLLRIEQRVLAGDAIPGVAWERLPVPPRARTPGPGQGPSDRPYDRRPRGELARLLHSTGVSPSGLPEAVLARLALGDPAGVSVPGEAPPPDVATLLLSGELPVRGDDLPFLARALGVAADPRVARLQQRLRAAPDPGPLPRAPSFARTRVGDRVQGWTVDGTRRVGYDMTLTDLLAAARVPPEMRAGHPQDPAGAGVAVAAVSGVEGLVLQVPARAPETLRLRGLRAALWLAVAGAIAGVVVIGRALRAEARANAREKRFLASVTHELRTPLAAIRLFGERLAEGRGDPREYGALVADECQRLTTLVEGVLAATRASERPSFAPVEPEALMRSAVALIQPRADRREVTLTCRAAAPLPTATWDADAVRRALLNLLDNAIKHGRQGGHVAAAAASEGDVVCLSVSDDGRGIGPQERAGLFGRFRRGRTEAPGTGLGLHFAEQVAHAHGGRIDLVSEEGRGCLFTLRLPARPPAADDAAGPTTP